MAIAHSRSSVHPSGAHRPPVEERIWRAAMQLYEVRGIRAITLRQIAEVAETNTPAVVKYFGPAGLVVEYVSRLIDAEEGYWEELKSDRPGEPEAQLLQWLGTIEGVTTEWSASDPLATVSAELSYGSHPAKKLVTAHKQRLRNRVAALCSEARHPNPEALADALFLLAEGARTAQIMGADGPAKQLVATAKKLFHATS